MRAFLTIGSVLLCLAAAAPAPAAAQTTCSWHRDACLRACQGVRGDCTDVCHRAHSGCMRSGTWQGKMVTRSGLQKR
jgi:hypothetical protein